MSTQPQIDPNTIITLRLPLHVVDLALQALNELPRKVSNHAAMAIEYQAGQQLQTTSTSEPAPTPGAPVEGDAGHGNEPPPKP